MSEERPAEKTSETAAVPRERADYDENRDDYDYHCEERGDTLGFAMIAVIVFIISA